LRHAAAVEYIVDVVKFATYVPGRMEMVTAQISGETRLAVQPGEPGVRFWLNVCVVPPPLGVKLIAIDCVAGETYAARRPRVVRLDARRSRHRPSPSWRGRRRLPPEESGRGTW
jgi:hypothetical protein